MSLRTKILVPAAIRSDKAWMHSLATLEGVVFFKQMFA